jgi:NADH:ubiquinone oxidoreductase subunit F (NADH-binding)
MDLILTKYIGEPNAETLDFYLKHEGYTALKKALGMKPAEVIDVGSRPA